MFLAGHDCFRAHLILIGVVDTPDSVLCIFEQQMIVMKLDVCVESLNYDTRLLKVFVSSVSIDLYNQSCFLFLAEWCETFSFNSKVSFSWKWMKCMYKLSIKYLPFTSYSNCRGDEICCKLIVVQKQQLKFTLTPQLDLEDTKKFVHLIIT